MPHCSIQVCFDTNWNPASPVSNEAISQIDIATVPTVDISAISLANSGRDFGVSGSQQRADHRHEDQGREDRERDRSRFGCQHHRIPRITTNQPSSSTTPMPMIPAY